MLLQMKSNSLVIKQKQKQTKYIYEDCVSKLNCKVKIFLCRITDTRIARINSRGSSEAIFGTSGKQGELSC